jgi:putative ABC transport system permease protein
MFFKQIRRNAERSRKDNGLFFGSLIVSIIAFYTLLSLDSQDVMRFLRTMESDAVSKLMLLIPLVYMVSLFFVFFLVYFAYRYQLEGRRKEFGLYLILGMRRSKLFALLMGETLWNSLVSILLGVPCALLLTEGTSLATARLVGLGIVGHKISFSPLALLGTVAGFMAVQFAAMLFLSAQLCRKEPMELINSATSEKQSFLPKIRGWIYFITGLICLLAAYAMGVLLLRSLDFKVMLAVLVLGIAGTFLLYHGMGVFIGHRIHKKSSDRTGLFTFTGRQIQENVIYQYKALAVASLLLLMALSCVSFGIGVASSRMSGARTADFSIEGTEDEVYKALGENKTVVSDVYPMYIDRIYADLHDTSGDAAQSSKGTSHSFSWEGLTIALEKQEQSDQRDNMLINFSQRDTPRIIRESSYNSLLTSIGKEPLHLDKNQAAMFTAMTDGREFMHILESALKEGAYVKVDEEQYELLPKLYSDNVVADRSITLYSALIVRDDNYDVWVEDSSEPPMCWNIHLGEKIVKEKGLMQAIEQVEGTVAKSGLEYESYLSGIGRNLFYTVASSYITIYLGILFMVIANTVIALKYMMQQRASKGRHITLLMLGASLKDLCGSAKIQIRLFFGLTIGLSAVSSMFAMWSMFTSFLRLPSGTSISSVIGIAGIAFIIFVVIEFIYMYAVERASSREIQQLQSDDGR